MSRRFTRKLFPHSHRNDNRSDLMTGNVLEDTQTLLEKWQYREGDARRKVWAELPDVVCKAVTRTAADVAGQNIETLRHLDAIWTAAAIGIARTLFYWIRQLPRAEAVYALEAVARLTDETVLIMRNEKPADKDKT